MSSIKKAIETCDAALDFLSQSSQAEDIPPAELAVIRQDFLSLLLLIYGSTTKISLAMKPKAFTYGAALSPLKDMSNHISALAHCTDMLLPKIHGATLVQEFNNICRDIIKSVKSLLVIFDVSETRVLESGDDYLVKTGEIHHLIDKARSSSRDGLSVDNLSAVRKKWQRDSGPLDDGLKELSDMIEYDADDGEDGEDDEWDELGLGSVKCLDEQELERAKQVYAIIRLSTLLHKRILQDFLSPSPSSALPNSDLDKLAPCSSALLSASDDLISSFYPPQDLSAIAAELNNFQESVDRLKSSLDAVVDGRTLQAQFDALNVIDKAPTSTLTKWYKTCFAQIQKTSQNLSQCLSANSET
ncbi:uncharacterized protein BT62DRAFT_998549 [Guyanagaster necrorhizus]|uniref:Cyclin-D1-binding protein 1 n=1 Tax=Guyanagaster necrorhizus TaxID=856835 RepID=A0A9P7W5F3_9AGAR|nr:uncharacterized protein BT62DRAFT_998549 [Guyanagaster necrorhizus MCA 3950]KAG7452519.1 hypothetical protein BT62DRAFT_998549 [Guyanagaster necrorhizus MCA 3950]